MIQNEGNESGRTDDQTPGSVKIKSLESRKRVSLQIYNTTHYSIDVIWIDFNGNEIPYAKKLKSGDNFGVSTFETHPWIFRDHESRERLAVLCTWQSKKLSKNDKLKYPDKIMMPEAVYNNDGQPLRTIAMVTYPVDSLRDMCFLRLYRSGLNVDKIKNLDIPVSLREEFSSFWKDRTPLRLYLQQLGAVSQ
ncbi:von Hippel-Lindau protein [Brevipalpus obovatus]|uniref:von Hippel-Lindau protein n=1 Tax=Brevipalpus obovatus TaxID=246614 RepID=UPI003D9E935C